MFRRIEALQVKKLGFEHPEEFFHYSIVQTVIFSAHALLHILFFKHSLVLFVLVLPALIGVQDRLCVIRDYYKGFLQHGGDHAEHRPGRNHIADQVLATWIKDRRKIQRLIKQEEFGTIGAPFLIWLRCAETSFHPLHCKSGTFSSLLNLFGIPFDIKYHPSH